MVACVRDSGYDCILNVCNRLKTYYIYALFDIRLWVPFYVGHSTRPYKRFAEHIQRSTSISDDIPDFCDVYDKNVYIRHMLDSGIVPVMVILDEIDTDCRKEAELLELAYINLFREAGFLITGWEGEGSARLSGLNRKEWMQHIPPYTSYVEAYLDSLFILKDMYQYG